MAPLSEEVSSASAPESVVDEADPEDCAVVEADSEGMLEEDSDSDSVSDFVGAAEVLVAVAVVGRPASVAVEVTVTVT